MIRGTKRELDKQPSAVNVDFNASIHNRFDIEVVDAKTGEVKQRAQAFNVICDNLWTQLLQGNRYFLYIHYGNGTGVPSTNDTKLFGFLGYGALHDAEKKWTVKADGAHVTGSIKLDETVAVGETLTEVGIATSTSATSLCTHAMLQDMNGNQVSILKTETDIINIYATVFLHWRNDSETVFISPSYKIDSDYGTTPTGMIGWLLGDSRGDGGGGLPNRAAFSETGSYDGTGAAVYDATKTYSLADKTITFKYPILDATKGNTSQILAVIIGAHGVTTTVDYLTLPGIVMLVGGDKIPAYTVEAEAIGTGDGVTTDFKTAFSNLDSATIYVDGVAQSGVTIDREVPFVTGRARAGIYPGIYNDGLWALSTTGVGATYMKKDNTAHYPKGGCAYNSFYATCGILTVNKNVLASNDLLTWTPVAAGTVPDAMRNYKYWKLETESSSSYQAFVVTRTKSDDNNIHFSTPPAAGAVITADYVTKTIPKDSNHVYDLEVTIGFGEYTEN